MIMKELYAQLGISSAVYDFGKSVEDSLKERFEKFDKTDKAFYSKLDMSIKLSLLVYDNQKWSINKNSR